MTDMEIVVHTVPVLIPARAPRRVPQRRQRSRPLTVATARARANTRMWVAHALAVDMQRRRSDRALEALITPELRDEIRAALERRFITGER